MKHILDASALLALIFDEDGAQLVADLHDTAVVSHVNVAEAATVLTRRGVSELGVRTGLTALKLPVLGGSETFAIEVGLLFQHTWKQGLSLGDRFCLALALRLNGTVVTSDRRLAEAAKNNGAMALLFR